ncbi:hypothetical protein PV797_08915 [Clostridiaceae bacterium M8S5]|nr:hypothetical protein PV797_08915 [Clostridiaceae bacterium M8S5]
MDNKNCIDKRKRLEENNFSYKITKDNKVMIYWKNQRIMILTGKKALKLIAELNNTDEYGKQLLLAKATGNFKHGNEKVSKNSHKNRKY